MPEKKGLLRLEEFVSEIKNDIGSGYGFVPFIGSGLSKPSGIMIGYEFAEYLSFVIYKCFRNYEHQEKFTAWNFSDRGWPEFPSLKEQQEAALWVEEQYQFTLQYGYGITDWVESDECREVEKNNVKSRFDGDPKKYFMYPPLYPLVLEDSKLTDVGKQKNQENIDEYIHKPVKDYMSQRGNNSKILKELLDKNLKKDARKEEKIDSLLAEFVEVFDEFRPLCDVDVESPRYIFEVALRSMHDWRSMLKFLSELDYESFNECITNRKYVYRLSGKANQHVIDGFNHFLARNAYPNLAHYLLVSLAQPMRIRRLLTTNFDDLIETTYNKMDLPLNVISVEKNSSLPSVRTVVSRDTLIKLHGSLNETRADHSLDFQSGKDDKKEFLKYIFPDTGYKSHYLPSRMIVMGSSLSDERSAGLIKHVFEPNEKRIRAGEEWQGSQFKLYFVAYNRADYLSFMKKFKRYRSNIVCVVCDRLDLLLLEVYQSLTNSLPPGGFTHQFSEFVPAIGRRTRKSEKYNIRIMRDILDILGAEDFKLVEFETTKIYSISAVDAYQLEEQSNEKNKSEGVKEGGEKFDSERKIFILDGTRNVQRLATILYDCLVQRFSKKVLWFDLEDFQSPIDLLSEIPRQIALRAGLYHSEHVILDFRQEVDRYGDDIGSIESSLNNLFVFLGEKMDDWAIIINGRELAGGCSGWNDEAWPVKDKHTHYVSLWNYFALLAKSGVKIFYMPFTTGASKSHEEMAYLELKPENVKDCRFEEIVGQVTPTAIDEGRYRQIPSLFRQLEEKQSYPEEVDTSHAEVYPASLFKYKQWLGWALKKMLEFSSLSRGVKDPKIIRAVSAAGPSSNMTSILQDMCAKKLSNSEEAALHYLYAITLFRQSRNTSALKSEALAISSWRYTCGLFGDIGGAEILTETESWLEALTSGNSKFFLIKRGGYRWFSSKRRILVQKILEEHTNIELTNLAGQERRLVHGLKQTRTIGHLWISDWYIRLFHATNHADPLIESFYHCISAINCLKDCRQSRQENDVSKNTKSTLDYRITILINTLSSIIKTFVISRNSLRFWMYGFQGHELFQWRVFSESIDGFEKLEDINLRSWIENIVNEKFDEKTFNELYLEKVVLIGELLLRISEECEKLYLELRRESNQIDYPVNFEYLRQFRNKMSPAKIYLKNAYKRKSSDIQNLGLEYNLEYYRAYEPGECYLKGVENRRDPLIDGESNIKSESQINEKLKQLKSLLLDIEGGAGPEEFDKFYEEVRKFERDSKVTSKSEDKDQIKIRNILQNLKQAILEVERDASTDKFEKFCDEIRKCKNDLVYNFQAQRRTFYHLSYFVSELVYIHVKRAKHIGRLNDITAGQKKESRKAYKISGSSGQVSWRIAGVLSRLCLELLHSMHPQYIHVEHSLKIKCLTLCGLSLARLNKFTEAHDLFRQANAIAFSLPVKDDKSERAIVRIRMAESHVLESVYVKNKIRNKYIKGGPKLDEKLLNLHLSKLDDAAAALDAAEYLLVGASHSSLWWGRVNFLRLRLFAEHYIREDSLSSVYPISYRYHKDYQQFLLSTLSKGLLTSRNDSYRSVTFVDIYIQALVKVTCHFQGRREKFNDSQQAITWYLEYLRLSLRKLYSLLTIGDFNIIHPNDICDWGKVLQLRLESNKFFEDAKEDMQAYSKHCADRIQELEDYIVSAKAKTDAAKNDWRALLDRGKQREVIA